MGQRPMVRRVSLTVLYVVPFLVLPMFVYQPGKLGLYFLAYSVQFVLMAAAVWMLVADRMRTAANNKTAFLLPGVFLIAAQVSTQLAAYMGPPPWPPDATWVATLADQHVRYVALLVGGLLAWAGLSLLTTRLVESGERIYGILGRAVISISMPLFVLFTLASLVVYDMRAKSVAHSGNVPDWWLPLVSLSLVWLGTYAVLTHLGTVFYAIGLAKVSLLGKAGGTVFVLVGTIAAVGALISISAHTIAIKEAFYPFMIPAVPFLLPYFLGVGLIGGRTSNRSTSG